MINIPDEPVVKDFKPLAEQILRTYGLSHLVPAMDQIEFMKTKLQSIEEIYTIRRLNFRELGWILSIYRS